MWDDLNSLARFLISMTALAGGIAVMSGWEPPFRVVAAAALWGFGLSLYCFEMVKPK
jgi:hypothetical protein